MNPNESNTKQYWSEHWGMAPFQTQENHRPAGESAPAEADDLSSLRIFPVNGWTPLLKSPRDSQNEIELKSKNENV